MPELDEYQSAVPAGELGIIALPGCEELARKINYYITRWRNEYIRTLPKEDILCKFVKDSYLIETRFDRFATGEGKVTVLQTVRGYDVFILCDCFNYGVTYEMFGQIVPTSPDDHFANLKRVISACAGKARRLTVIMPMLYEGRQHRRAGRESLDCAMALLELQTLGVNNLITFDAHDSRVANSIPLGGFEDVKTTYQMLKALLRTTPDVHVDKNALMVVSPDEGGMSRCIYYANMLGVDVGMFYKRRDYSVVVKGRNPIIAHEFLGDNVRGKDIIVPDDMISSGDSTIEVATKLKNLGAKRIFVCASFGLFCNGLDRFGAAHAADLIDKVFTTNLIYNPPALLAAPWHVCVDMSKYISYLIDTINHDRSLSRLLTPNDRIARLLAHHQLENAHE